MKIFVDMDGVLVDFISGAVKIFNRDYDELIKTWLPSSYSIATALGITEDEFFSTLEWHGENFWATLPAYPYARDLFDYCESLAPTCILSAPTLDPNCLSGKVKWLQNWLGRYFRDFIITPKKELCARPDYILVDDHESNTNAFQKAGGKTVLFPSWANSRYKDMGNIELVKKEIKDLLNG